MEKETLSLNKNTLSVLMKWNVSYNTNLPKKYIKEAEDYKVISDDINSVDPEDGGFEATAIILRKSDNKYFSLDYQEWDYHWEFGDFKNYEPELTEVFPKEVTKIIYE